MKPPYLNKDRWERRTRTPRYYEGEPLALHRLPDGEWCAWGESVEIYVRAETREDAKVAARRSTPSWYRNLKWRK